MKKKKIRNCFLFGAAATASLHIANCVIQYATTKLELLKTDHGRFYEWKYGKIYYTKSGKGSPVILIHDLDPASSSLEWERIAKTLSKNHTVYALDLLGCGRSSKPNLTYTNYLYVQMLTDFIRNVVREKSSIVSTGRSCSFTVMACNMEPDYYDRLMLINPESLTDLNKTPDKWRNVLKALIDMPILGTFIYNMRYSNYRIYKMFAEKLLYQNYMISTKILDSYYESAHLGHSNGKYLFSSIQANYTGINISHALRKIDNRICIIVSKKNDSMKSVAENYQHCNPEIQTIYMDYSKYLPQMETPEKLLTEIENFL